MTPNKEKNHPPTRNGTETGSRPAGRESDRQVADEVKEEFEDAAARGRRNGPPETSARARKVPRTEGLIGGEEPGGIPIEGDGSVGGTAPGPEQDEVDDLGDAAGISYADNEPMHTAEKLDHRDEERWELNPASSEDYEEREREQKGRRPKKS